MTRGDATAGGTRELVERFYAAYNAHRPGDAAALYTASGSHVEVAQNRVGEGRDAVRGGLEHFLTCFPDAHWQPEQVVVGETGAAVTYRLTGTLQAQLGPFQPLGQRLDLQGVHVFTVEDGAISRTADYWDSGAFGRQMKPKD